jgi:hypothetical protein
VADIADIGDPLPLDSDICPANLAAEDVDETPTLQNQIGVCLSQGNWYQILPSGPDLSDGGYRVSHWRLLIPLHWKEKEMAEHCVDSRLTRGEVSV